MESEDEYSDKVEVKTKQNIDNVVSLKPKKKGHANDLEEEKD